MKIIRDGMLSDIEQITLQERTLADSIADERLQEREVWLVCVPRFQLHLGQLLVLLFLSLELPD